jgi:accessory gene regulator protein AgrB
MNLPWRDIMLIVLEVLALLFAITFMFVGIWGFILMHRIYNQLRYKNYLFEKLVENTASLHKKDVSLEESGNKEDIL